MIEAVAELLVVGYLLMWAWAAWRIAWFVGAWLGPPWLLTVGVGLLVGGASGWAWPALVPAWGLWFRER